MVEVVVFAEGQSDEAFLKRVVAPSLREDGVFIKPLTLHISRTATGGAINFDRQCFNVRNTLRQDSKRYNDGYTTKPSARLAALLTPRYHKTLHAPLIGQHVGLSAIVRECPHFAAWVHRLRALQPL